MVGLAPFECGCVKTLSIAFALETGSRDLIANLMYGLFTLMRPVETRSRNPSVTISHLYSSIYKSGILSNLLPNFGGGEFS